MIRLHIGDVRAVLAEMEPGSVDLVATSWPFLALRSYLPNDHPSKALEIGQEATPADYLDTLLDVTEGFARVLAPHGSICTELGDTMAGSGGAGGDYNADGLREGQGKFNGSALKRRKHGVGDEYRPARTGRDVGWPLDKSMCVLPHLYAASLAYGRNLLNPERITDPWRVRNIVAWVRCLHQDTPVYVRTPTGDRPMRVLHLHQQFAPGKFQVWTGERWTAVTETVPTMADDAIEIEFRTGERITCTRDHRWPVNSILGTTKVLRSDELTVGDVVPQVRLPEPADPIRPTHLPDDDIGWFVGVFLADGSFDTKGRIQIAGHQINDALRGERLKRIAADYDGTSSVYAMPDQLGGSVVVRCKPLAAVIRHYLGGDNARNKHLNPTAWRRSDGFLAALLNGYLVSDGHFDAKNQRWRLGFTDNPWLARDLRTVAARLGLPCIIRRVKKAVDIRGGQWAGSASFGHRGEIRLEGHLQSARSRPKPRGEIVAIRTAAKARTFIDISVADEPHTFALASGLLTHNSNPPVGSLGGGTPEEGTGDARFRAATSYLTIACKGRSRWFDLDAVRGPLAKPEARFGRKAEQYDSTSRRGTMPPYDATASAGAPPLDWWLVNPKGYSGAHYAVWPLELLTRPIQAMCPRRVCRSCGVPSRRITFSDGLVDQSGKRVDGHVWSSGVAGGKAAHTNKEDGGRTALTTTLGWTVCGCADTGEEAMWTPAWRDVLRALRGAQKAERAAKTDDAKVAAKEDQRRHADALGGLWRGRGDGFHAGDGWRPGVVLDPFMGSGTSAAAASGLSRDVIGIDIDERNVAQVETRLGPLMATMLEVERV